ncbi:hypothetical protein ENINMM134B_08930 [Enterobacter intestinihominis]|nr:hypothetical protein SK63_00800 [Enterobacter sp. BIDMC110]
MGCLYRDGFNEINYLVSVAMSMYEERETEHAEAIEEDKRFTWLANRWSLFWAGCDYFTRRTMIEDAHAEALRIDAEQYAAPVTSFIFQRNDGVQLALDSSCDARFIRTSKNGKWFKAGFRNTDTQIKTGAMIAIPLSLSLNGIRLSAIIDRCRLLSTTDFLISAGKRKNSPDGAIHLDSLTKGFVKARKLSGLEFSEHPPSFHEIRSLSGRTYEASRGKDFVQKLFGHTSKKMTEKYLDVREKVFTLL